jgi:excisionase family DNA binding protein
MFLTPRQVAERWGCSPRHVRRLCRSGELRAMRLGQDAWRISMEAVETFEQARTSGAASSTSDEGRKAEVVRPVFGVLVESGADLVLPERWWESQPTTGAASSAAGRGRSTGKKKTALSSH